jgi:glycine betaine/proline transport system ATP-binding protein
VALQRLISYDKDYGYVLDKERRFVGVISADRLKEEMDREGDTNLLDAILEKIEPVNINEPMQNILELITKTNIPIPVVDDENRFKGVISRNSFLKSLYSSKVEMGAENV